MNIAFRSGNRQLNQSGMEARSAMDVDTRKQQHRSGLFLIRMWTDPEDDEQGALRGRVLDVTSGKAESFHGWPELLDLLTNLFATQILEHRVDD